MNRNASEESSLPGITSVPSIPRHAELGPVPAEAGRPLAEPFVAGDLPESWAANLSPSQWTGCTLNTFVHLHSWMLLFQAEFYRFNSFKN